MIANERKYKIHVNTLVNNCLAFAGHNGKTLSRGSSTFSSSLAMKCESRDLVIEFVVNVHPMGNGGCRIMVMEQGNLVFEASGNYVTRAFNMEASTYVPGDWENKIPVWAPEN